MKVVKPQKLGILLRTYEHDRKCYMAVSILAMFPFGSPTRLFPDAELWKFAAEALGPEGILDAGMPKPQGEVLVIGNACNVGGPRLWCAVRAQIGSVDKTLKVVGDRLWPIDPSSGRPASPSTPPQPFDEMPVSWARAYGGEGYAKNPLGRGYWTKKTLDGKPLALPNVEDPRHPTTDPDEQAEPAGFGAYDLVWPQRFANVGTYDARWLKEQFPGFALDMDPRIFSAAPPDQQIAGFFRGDEPFVVDGMNRSTARIEGTLPGLAGRAFLRLRDREGLLEVKTQIDTVMLFPNAERGIVLFRGRTEIAEEDGDDVTLLLLAAEKLGADPLPLAHYEEVLTHRLDRKKAAAYALRDRDLMPEPDPDAPRVAAPEDDLTAVYRPELLTMAAMKRRMANERAAGEARIVEAGLDPEKWQMPLPAEDELPPEDPVERAEYTEKLIARAEMEASMGKARAEVLARAQCKEAGLDFDAVVAKAREESGGPPKFSAQAELVRYRLLAELAHIGGDPDPEIVAKAGDPALEAKLVAMEKQILDVYRGYAHHFPPAPLASAERTREVRDELALSMGGPRAPQTPQGEGPRPSFAGRDLTGVDLAGLDLSGCDFAEALLERADLSGAVLGGAVLRGAVLTRANLIGAKLDGADLERANLGGADLTRATLRGAKLGRAVLAKATLVETVFDDASLDDADLSEATFRGTSFVRARGARLTFNGGSLSGVRFDEADMPRCRFLECSLADVSFARARFAAVTLMSVKGSGLSFDDAHLDGLRVVVACDLGGASFKRASMVKANLREALLEGADFEGADLSRADLSKAKLAGAKLHHVRAREARFDRADLSRADLTGVDGLMGSFQKATFCGADLRGSSFFGADFLRIVVDKDTQLEGAGLGRVRYVAGRPPHGS